MVNNDCDKEKNGNVGKENDKDDDRKIKLWTFFHIICFGKLIIINKVVSYICKIISRFSQKN